MRSSDDSSLGPPRETLAQARAPLAHYLRALWGLDASLHDLPEAIEATRPRLSNIGLHLPPCMRAWRGLLAERAYFAAAAHCAAHLAYSTHRHAVGTLKPVQRVLLGLLEDARVEHLAAREMPGLRALWLPMHVASPDGGTEVRVLLARLSRALLDPRDGDPHPWVRKGRELFTAGDDDRRGPLADPAALREAASLLGNDIGQMRLQFDARSWSVEPAYRDDNGHLWQPEDGDPPPDEWAELPESARPASGDSATPTRVDDRAEQVRALRERPVGADAEPPDDTASALPPRRYREWDRLIGAYRDDWVTVRDAPIESQPATATAAAMHPVLLKRLKQLLRASQIERPQRRRGVPEGDTLDLVAAVDHAVARRQGLWPDRGVYIRTQKRRHDLAVLLLLDLSRSVSLPDASGPDGALPVIRDAALLAAQAIVASGDRCAIHAFRSEGRERVHYLRIKDFDQALDDAVLERLLGVRGAFSTRLGAALRHATALAAVERSQFKLVIVLTDGEPYDIDVHDPAYLVDDSRKAVQEARGKRVDVCGIGVEGDGAGRAERVFGRRGHVTVPRVDALPDALRALYLRLAQ